MTHWYPIEHVKPPECANLWVTGPSGYAGIPKFICFAYYNERFRPRPEDGRIRWLDESSDTISDRGYYPTHWAYPEELP
jgi:hypothetical protein